VPLLCILLGALSAAAHEDPPDDPSAAAERAMAEAKALQAEGTADANRRAAERLEEAARLWHDVADPGKEAAALDALSTVYFRTELQRTLPVLERLLALARGSGDRAREARTLSRMGVVFLQTGDPVRAREVSESALVPAREVGNRELEAQTLGNIGLSHWRTGEHGRAFETYRHMLAFWRDLGNRGEEARVLTNLGLFHYELGEVQESLDLLRQALVIRRTLKDRGAETFTLLNLGDVYIAAGESQRALEHYEPALAHTRAAGDRFNEARALQGIGLVRRSQGDLAAALVCNRDALKLQRDAGNRVGASVTLYTLGHLHRARREPAEARAAFEESLDLARQVGDPIFQGRALAGLGLVLADAKDRERAWSSFDEALALFRSAGDRSDEAAALYERARLQGDRGRLEEARAEVEAAIALIEDRRSSVVSSELRATYVASNRAYYELHVDVLMGLHARRPDAGLDALALAASERGRARGLLDTLAEARAGIREGVGPDLLEAERELRRRLASKERLRMEALGKGGRREGAGAIERDLEGLLGEYRDLQERLRASSLRYADLTRPEPLSLAEIQRDVMDAQSLLVEYALGDERSFVWAVSRDSVRSHVLPGRKAIEDAARRFYDAVRQSHRRGSRGQAELAAAELSRVVLGPVSDLLGRSRLLVVAEGALQYVPFGALPHPSRRTGAAPLIVSHEVVHLPSASSLSVLRRDLAGRAPARKLVAVLSDPVFRPDDPRVRRPAVEASGNAATETSDADVTRAASETGLAALERLTFSRREADAIAALAPPGGSLKALDFAASRATAMSDSLADYRIVHFAAHGFLNSRHPELSGIALSLVDEAGRPQDGFLRLADLYNLKLRADLVVLSACQTALGQEVKGEGLVGLTRGFFYAGAPRVVASLWSVRDEATAELMRRFYRALIQDGLPPSAALRSAQVSLWKESRWRAPYYWAGFVLQGEWRPMAAGGR
jgi:CHAT domain-containing protein/Tfp pilus assembly protein PilF